MEIIDILNFIVLELQLVTADLSVVLGIHLVIVDLKLVNFNR